MFFEKQINTDDLELDSGMKVDDAKDEEDQRKLISDCQYDDEEVEEQTV